jgi:hypothetical protein
MKYHKLNDFRAECAASFVRVEATPTYQADSFQIILLLGCSIFHFDLSRGEKIIIKIFSNVCQTARHYISQDYATKSYFLQSFLTFNKFIEFVDIFNLLYLILEFNQPLTELGTRNIKIIMFLGSKVRPVRRADNITAICEPIV